MLPLLASIWFVPGCLLHSGDDFWVRSEQFDIVIEPGGRFVGQFEVTADEETVCRLDDFGAQADAFSSDAGVAEPHGVLTLRHTASGDEVTYDLGGGGYDPNGDTLPFNCQNDRACSTVVEVEISREDDDLNPWMGSLTLYATGRVNCCGDVPGRVQIAAVE